jgi:predicted ribosomally synthesized peptide with SipW-like signal peptide
MKQRIDKTAVLFIVSIFVLSGIGISYAAWTDTITIEGTVTTGDLCWEFISCGLRDEIPPVNPGGDYPVPSYLVDYTCNPGFAGGTYWRLDKNVGWGEQLIKDLDGDGCNETLEITLHNVYPCYFNELAFYVRNCGTLPLKIDHVVINGQSYYSGMPKIEYDLNGNNVSDFEVYWRDNFGFQIEPGQDGPEISFWMHVLQDEDPAYQSNSFTFTIQLVCIQWNEYTGGP